MNEFDLQELQVPSHDRGMAKFWRRIHRNWMAHVKSSDKGRGAHTDYATFWKFAVRPLAFWQQSLVPDDMLDDFKKMATDGHSIPWHSKLSRQRDLLPTNLVARLRNRKACISAKGHFCVVPFHAKPGDAMSILHRGQLPCVLRAIPKYVIQIPSSTGEAYDSSNFFPSTPRNGPGSEQVTHLRSSHQYQFVGGCCVAGVTRSEALEACIKDGTEVIDFWLA